MSDPAGRSSISSRVLVTGGIVAMALVLLMMGMVERSVRSIWLADLDEHLVDLGESVAAGLGAGDDDAWITEVSNRTGIRVTLIAPDGLVVADSHEEEAELENHGDRPEVVAALRGKVGHATRLSESSGFAQRYVALPFPGLVVRVSTPTSVIEDRLSDTRRVIAMAGVTVAALAIGLLVLTSRRLVRPLERLAAQAEAVAAGDLTVVPERSSVIELDQMAVALGSIVRDLGGRIDEAEQASSTLEAVLASLPQATLLFSGDDTLVYASPAAGEMLGRVPERLASLAPLQLQEMIRSARSGSVAPQEMEHGLPARWLRAVASRVDDSGRVVLIVSDVTERARLEAMRRDFVANASHELKTPVATAIASAEALQIALSRDDPSAERFAARVSASARHLERLVADLLDLSRLEQESPVLAPVDLGALVVEETEGARQRVEDNGLTLSVETIPVTISGDDAALRTAIRNLIDNAVRHTAAGGSIYVRVGSSDGFAVVDVADTGEGIPTADLDRVFERFYRVDTARSRETGGTGLGLAIVRHVVEGHGGRVSVTSELGQGSTFTVELPLRP